MPVLKTLKNGVWEPVSGMSEHTHTKNDITDLQEKVYTQPDEPVDAPVGAVWVDTDEDVGFGGSGGGGGGTIAFFKEVPGENGPPVVTCNKTYDECIAAYDEGNFIAIIEPWENGGFRSIGQHFMKSSDNLTIQFQGYVSTFALLYYSDNSIVLKTVGGA